TFVLELEFNTDGNSKVPVVVTACGNCSAGGVVGAVACPECVGRNTENPLRRTIQVDVTADYACRCDAIRVEADFMTTHILIKVSVGTAEHSVGDECAVLVVRPK